MEREKIVIQTKDWKKDQGYRDKNRGGKTKKLTILRRGIRHHNLYKSENRNNLFKFTKTLKR